MEKRNKEFLTRIQTFMDGKTGITSSQNLRGDYYPLDANNVGTFDLQEGRHGDAQLVKFKRKFFKPRFFAHPIRAYYLASSYNQTRTISITNHAEVFFTDTLTGCLFAAYGPNRFNLTVEHTNAFSLGQPAILARRALIAGWGNAVTLFYGPQEYRNHPQMPANADPMLMIATVVGILDPANGWTFYGRVRNSGDHQVLGANASVI